MPLLFFIFTILWQQPFAVKCSAFAANDFIPERYSCEGTNINPEFYIENIPANAKTLAFIVEDPDPAFGTFDHWVVWNIPLSSKIKEDSAPGIVGVNSRKENKYTGPCPPSGVHTYHFKLYALDANLNLPKNSGKKELLAAMQSHIIATAETAGRFNK